MQTKASKKNDPQFIRNLRAACAAGVKQTAGRARTFADRHDILAAEDGADEISEGIAEYRERKAMQEAQNGLADLIQQQTCADLACL